MLLPKFVAAISTPGVRVGNRLVAGGKLGVLKIMLMLQSLGGCC